MEFLPSYVQISDLNSSKQSKVLNKVLHKLENEIYYFEEKDTFGMMTWKYDKFGKMIRDGKGQEGKT